MINFATAKHEHVNLIIDIGNTLAKLVAFDGDTPVEEIKTSNETLERLPEFVNKYAFKQGIVGSVFGITAEAERQLKRLDFPLLYLNAQTPVPITNDYRTPDTLGADRLAAAVGACLGCTCETRSGEGKSVCKNGPVFDAAEVF